MALGDFFIALVEETCGAHGFALVSPRQAEARGSQVSFSHPDGFAIMQALIARGVIGDFRAPDVLRFGLTPLYLRYVDVFDAVMVLNGIMETGAWKDPAYAKRGRVT